MPSKAGPATARIGWTAAALAGVVLIGWLDYVTGPEIGFSLFYLLPVVASAQWLGRGPVLITATVAAVAWFCADHWARPENAWPISTWNAVTRFGIFVAVGLLMAKVREDGERLRMLVDREWTLARTDALTGLPNARALLETAERELARSRRSGTATSVAYLDLNNFKQINDRHGHDEGDRLLQRVAEIVRRSIRATDFAARLGGDEFAVLFWNVDEASAHQVCDRIVAEVDAMGREYAGTGFGISAGVVCFAQPPTDAHELLKRADAAMYENKRLGRHPGRGPISRGA